MILGSHLSSDNSLNRDNQQRSHRNCKNGNFFLKKKKGLFIMDVYERILEHELTHISVRDLYDQLIFFGHLSPVDRATIRVIQCPECHRVLEPHEYSAIHLHIEDMVTNDLLSTSEKMRRRFMKMMFYDIQTICPYCYNHVLIPNQSKAIIVAPISAERSTTIEKAQ